LHPARAFIYESDDRVWRCINASQIVCCRRAISLPIPRCLSTKFRNIGVRAFNRF
jgi:hypothetical protein